MLSLPTRRKSVDSLHRVCQEIEMSVFREKNGICEGANPLCNSATARRAPAGRAEMRKTRLETHPGRCTIGKGLCFSHSENWCDSSHPTNWRFGGKEVTTRTKIEH